MSSKSYEGSCHCGRLKYRVNTDFSNGTYKCNCRYCAKVRNWGCIVKPPDFAWLSDTKSPQSTLGIYQINPGSKNFYYFCSHCGVRLATSGYIEEIGGDYVSFSVATLDNVSAEELAALPVTPMDGRNDNWFNHPAVHSHL